MKKKWLIIFTSMFIAAIWGYFIDLKNGNITGFIYKIVFVGAFMLALQYSINRSKKKDIKK
ncbi:hypothetical protein [Clostridium cochlearium]|uniref:Uncharacterized protein n=1 Tax=Clostridium cochlearium TaxID=1494 RepID=A0A2X2WC56_CLOCO|nr:hypothetical protein [Clostridium cochlearium]MBE6064538.1 hypothetical protein [Clostridium cochlearium]SQB35233.1 Uncharacterised protein [Clostridium cochlearium]